MNINLDMITFFYSVFRLSTNLCSIFVYSRWGNECFWSSWKMMLHIMLFLLQVSKWLTVGIIFALRSARTSRLASLWMSCFPSMTLIWFRTWDQANLFRKETLFTFSSANVAFFSTAQPIFRIIIRFKQSCVAPRLSFSRSLLDIDILLQRRK